MDPNPQNSPKPQPNPPSPQPGPGLQPSAPPGNAGYDQYLGAPPSRSRRKLVILIAGGLLALLILILIVVAAAKPDKKNQASQQQPAKVTVACTDKNCLVQNFSKCFPAEYTLDESGSRIKYTITGILDTGCKTDVEYVDSRTFGAAIGKKMTCQLDNRLEFDRAVQNANNFPDDYFCQGDLADLIKVINTENALQP